MLPAGADIFDSHLHLGTDIDGMIGDYDVLEEQMSEYGISRAFVFCLDEPDRHPAFSAANDRTLGYADALRRSPDPVRTARPERDADPGGRALPRRRRARDQAASARAAVRRDRRPAPAGVRARGRAARPDPDPRRPRAAADRRRARTARRGEPRRHADHRPRRDRRSRPPLRRDGRPEGRAVRHLDLGRDRPARPLPARPARAGRLRIGLPVRTAAELALHRAPNGRYAPGSRRARSAGCSARRATPSPTAASCRSRRPRSASSVLQQPIPLARIHGYLSMAMPFLWLRQQETLGALGLALNTAAERDGQPETTERIESLLETATELWATLPRHR